MATLQEYIYDVKMLAHRMRISDDVRLTNRMITFWINHQRAMWLRRQENRSYRHDPQLVQSLGALPVETVDVSAAPVNVKTGMSILRTTHKIPKTLYLDELDDGIYSVGSIDNLAPRFHYVDYKRMSWVGNSKYNSDEIFAFRLNKQSDTYLYLYARDNMELKSLAYVNVRGIFENPLDLQNYTDVDGVSMFDVKNSDYPINDAMWEFMKQQISKTNFQYLAEMPTDTTNDANYQKNE